jgi:hypothetical protein
MNCLAALLLMGFAAFAQAEVTCDECVEATSKYDLFKYLTDQ